MRCAVMLVAIAALVFPTVLVPSPERASASGDPEPRYVVAFENERTGEIFTALLTDAERASIHPGAFRELRSTCEEPGRLFEIVRSDGVYVEDGNGCCDVVPARCWEACGERVSHLWVVRKLPSGGGQ